MFAIPLLQLSTSRLKHRVCKAIPKILIKEILAGMHAASLAVQDHVQASWR